MGLMANILGTIGHNRATVGTGTRICTHADARVGAYVYVHIYKGFVDPVLQAFWASLAVEDLFLEPTSDPIFDPISDPISELISGVPKMLETIERFWGLPI